MSYSLIFQIIWSDEKMFNLDGPDGSRHYWHDLRKEKQYFSKRNFGGGNVMTWAGFSARGKLQLKFVTNRMNSADYQNVLTDCLLPFYRQNDVFVQDNARIHVSRTGRHVPYGTLNWLQDNNIDVLPWPSCSPDLNLIENLWGIIVRRIYANNRRYQNVDELKTAISQAWAGISQEVIDNLVLSMDNRIFQVINRQVGIQIIRNLFSCCFMVK